MRQQHVIESHNGPKVHIDNTFEIIRFHFAKRFITSYTGIVYHNVQVGVVKDTSNSVI